MTKNQYEKQIMYFEVLFSALPELIYLHAANGLEMDFTNISDIITHHSANEM
jgi:hypothetical protein